MVPRPGQGGFRRWWGLRGAGPGAECRHPSITGRATILATLLAGDASRGGVHRQSDAAIHVPALTIAAQFRQPALIVLAEAGGYTGVGEQLLRQVGEGEGLGQNLSDTDFGCGVKNTVGWVAGDEHAGEARLARFQRSEGLQAIHAGQSVIQYQQVGSETGDAFERRFTARHGPHLRRALGEVIPHVRGENLLVFYDQYLCLR